MKSHGVFVFFSAMCAATLSQGVFADLPPGELGVAIERYQHCINGVLQANQGNLNLTVAMINEQCAQERSSVATQAGKQQQESLLAEIDKQTATVLPARNVTTRPLPTDAQLRSASKAAGSSVKLSSTTTAQNAAGTSEATP